MKKLLLSVLLLLSFVPGLPAQDLKKEWRQYYRLSRKDRPREAIEKLHEIRTLALERRLPDDLMNACRYEEWRYAGFNWKGSDSLHTALTEVVESYGEPLLTYRWLNQDWDYALAHRAELAAGSHPALQSRSIPFLQTEEEDDIQSDFEWILWDRITRYPHPGPDSEECRLLSEEIGERYPAKPYLQYLMASRAEDRLSAMQALAEEYAGDPFRFLPQKVVLDERMIRLRQDKTATEADARALDADAEAFAKAAAAEKGVHRRADLSVDGIRKTLRYSEFNIRFRNDSIVLTGRNFGRGTLTFFSDETRQTVSFRNRDERFYVRDTVTAPVPELPDGTYHVYSETYGGLTVYEKHTLSLAVRRQGEDYAVYVADYKTGEPVPSATFRLRNKRKVLEREIPLNGFTPLPDDFRKLIGKKTVTLEAQIGDRRSALVRIPPAEESAAAPPANLHGRIFLERSAYRPGDTLKAKAVLFTGDLQKRVTPVKEGEAVRVHIFSAEGNAIADIDLKTNSFGSIAWEFPIPAGERNGLFGIYVHYPKSVVAHTTFRVDDFVLPTFDISFDGEEAPYLPDTDFEISGKVTGYSGHPVDGITLEGAVSTRRYAKEVWKGPVSIDKDGAFRIPLHLEDTGEYRLELQAVDATGENRKAAHTFEISTRLFLDVELENAAQGDFSFRTAKLEKGVLTADSGHFRWTVKNGTRPVRLPVDYQLLDEEGRTVLEGTADEVLELDLSGCPDGLYFLQGIAKANEYQARATLPLLKLTSALDAPVRSVFLSGETEILSGERIRARLGAGSGPLWAVATLAAPDGTLLESRLVHLDGVRGRDLAELGFTYKGSYPDAVRLEVFYFRDAEQVVHEAVYHRVRLEMDLPLAFSRFTDRTMPGAPCTLSLQTEAGAEVAVAVFDKSLDAVGPNVWEAVLPEAPVFRKAWSQSLAGIITGERSRSVSGVGAVYGFVTDTMGEPLIGATVVVDGTVQGVVTDVDGCFALDVPAGTPLTVYCIGYLNQSVTASAGMQVVLQEDYEMLDETVVIAYGVSKKRSVTDRLSGAVQGVQVRGMSGRRQSSPAIYGARSPEAAQAAEMFDLQEDDYRTVFSEALAFEPFLYPDAAGKVDVSFRASDKLSSYHVNVFAHDRAMRNAVLQRDIVVTIPVRISVTPPRYLYENDEYTLAATVSSIADAPLSGRLYLQVNGERLSTQAAELTVPAGGTASALFSLAAPAGDEELDIRLIFESAAFSDAVRLSVPVYRAAQPLTECHSALAGMEAVDSLRRMFVNAPGEQAEVTLRTLREVAEAGLAEWTVPGDPDALTLSADFYARALLGRDTTGTLAPLLALRCEDGGFAWTEGMESSPLVTATILERFAVLRDKGIDIPDLISAVKYLDVSQFSNWMPMWCGGLSDEQYMDIRAMWAAVPFDLSRVEEKAVRRYRLKEFRRFARAYLTPGRYDYANGWVLDKARRVRTLRNLTASDEGLALGKAWGEQLFTASRFDKTIANDLASLRQYAVRHPSGALYYPNAVLPFKGLLSSEVYAHTLLAGLLDGPVSDGLKLWLALQNGTQSWTGEPAYVDALQAVLTAPDSLLDRRLVTLTATASVPFGDIRAAGNGMQVERKFYREQDGVRTEIQPGDTLRVGERIVARYELRSTENRSFVRVDAFREAALLPVDQLSGQLGADERKERFRIYRVDGLWTRLPQCYRDVRARRTAWWLDVCPEEKSTLEESFFVTQAGTFTAPVVTVECLYAPEYRANDAFPGPLNAD